MHLEQASSERSYAFLVDSTKLRSTDLAEYLAESPLNLAVISEVTAFEPYRSRRTAVIARNLEIICTYPRQLRILRGTHDIAALEASGAISALEYVDPAQTAGTSDFCAGVLRAADGDSWYVAAMAEHVAAAEAHVAQLRSHMTEVAAGLKAFGKGFSRDSLAAMRAGERYPPEVQAYCWHFITGLARDMFTAHYGSAPFDERTPLTVRRFLFRYAAAGTMLALWWTRNGGLDSVRPEKLANDLIDMQQAAIALKFDGLMSTDAKLMDIYHETWALLTVVEESLSFPPQDPVDAL